MDRIGYVSLAEADNYVDTHYLLDDPCRASWGASVEDHTVFLTKAFQALEILPYTGRKLSAEQQQSFPRWPCKEVPNAVKWAQIEEALAIAEHMTNEDSGFYRRLRANGVTSYSIGNLSESLSPEASKGSGAAAVGLLSTDAWKLLRPYLGGGYRM